MRLQISPKGNIIRYIMLYHVISCYIMLYHVISCYIMLYHVISCYIFMIVLLPYLCLVLCLVANAHPVDFAVSKEVLDHFEQLLPPKLTRM